MSYILSSDWHCHAWTQFAKTNEDGLNDRLGHILHEIERQAITANAGNINRIFCAGDVFHVRGSIKPTVFNPVAAQLNRCVQRYGVEFVLIPGNHDLEGAETDELSSAITSLATIPGVIVVNEPTVFEEERVVMVPWHNTREGLLEAIDSADMDGKRGDYDLILHTGINGVIVGMPHHAWAASELAALGFGRVFCGHYHHHVVFEETHEGYPVTVTSIGALTHQTWGDVGTKAGFMVVTSEDAQHCPSEAPEFVALDEGFDVADAKGNYVRVKGIEMTHEEIAPLREALFAEGAKGVIIDPLVKTEVTRDGVSSEGAEGIRVEGQIEDYAVERYGDLAEAISRKSIEVLNDVRSVK